jgi:hypothetical protein
MQISFQRGALLDYWKTPVKVLHTAGRWNSLMALYVFSVEPGTLIHLPGSELATRLIKRMQD